MSDDIFRKLQEHLHQHPMGFPATSSGVEIALLKKLFAEEEAKIALALTPQPESAAKIASKIGYEANAMAKKLEGMARKGLVMRRRKENETLYNLEPYLVGIYEFQVARIDKELIDLHEKYRREALGMEVMGSKTPYFRIITVEKSLPSGFSVLSYENIMNIIEEAGTIVATECLCRKKQKMMSKGCEHTIQNCMIFCPWAEYYLENGWPAQKLTKEEAKELIREAEKEGLVHTSQNTSTKPSFICNCCSCSCGILGAVRNLKLHNQVNRTPYYAQVDENLCAGCEECVRRCPSQAMTIENMVAKVNQALCMGCGVCNMTCPTEAISLIRKPEDQINKPPANLEVMFAQIGKEKGRKMKVVLEE